MEDKIFITFDIDWACDEVLFDTFVLIEKLGVKATFFATHLTSVLDRLRDNKNIELGIHPNFNDFFLSQSKSLSVSNVIESLKRIVPEATSVRSHSLAQSSYLLEQFSTFGLTYDLNLYIPAESGIKLAPFIYWNGMIRIPYFWEDDGHCLNIQNGFVKDWDVDFYLNRNGLKVFNFHPIHIYLNTEDLDRYEQCRHVHNDTSMLKDFVNADAFTGTRVFLENLVKEAKKRGIEFGLIRDINV